jgi:hypothetical protein
MRVARGHLGPCRVACSTGQDHQANSRARLTIILCCNDTCSAADASTLLLPVLLDKLVASMSCAGPIICCSAVLACCFTAQ